MNDWQLRGKNQFNVHASFFFSLTNKTHVRMKSLSSEKDRLERIAETVSLKSEALKEKEVAARALVSSVFTPQLQAAKKDGLRRFLRFIYHEFPPKDPSAILGSLDGVHLDRTAKIAIQHYHPDRCDVELYGLVWRYICTG